MKHKNHHGIFWFGCKKNYASILFCICFNNFHYHYYLHRVLIDLIIWCVILLIEIVLRFNYFNGKSAKNCLTNKQQNWMPTHPYQERLSAAWCDGSAPWTASLDWVLRDNRKSSHQRWPRSANSWSSRWTSSKAWCCNDVCLNKINEWNYVQCLQCIWIDW